MILYFYVHVMYLVDLHHTATSGANIGVCGVHADGSQFNRNIINILFLNCENVTKIQIGLPYSERRWDDAIELMLEQDRLCLRLAGMDELNGVLFIFFSVGSKIEW